VCDIFKYLNDITVRSTLMWLIVLRISQQHAVHVRACILEQFVGSIEYDQRNLTIAQNTQFVRFLHEAKFPLRKRHLHANMT